jgi:eukaryotic-like serine/threonine-protein kinase
MRRFFNLVLGALAMLTVALISAFIAMRLAIHGREVEVPKLTGLSVSEASRAAADKGLNLTLESHFYSTTVPAGQVIAQEPAPDSRVRREWAVRITDSLGPQRVQVPDLTGETERAASVAIRRLALEPGAVAHLALPGEPGIVLAQTPLSNTGGADGPRVSLLLSQSEDEQPPAYVMPSFIGLTLAAATARANAAGLRLTAGETFNPTDLPPNSEYGIAFNQAQHQTLTKAQADLLSLNPYPTAHATSSSTGTIVTQYPLAGRRILKGDTIHVSLGH